MDATNSVEQRRAAAATGEWRLSSVESSIYLIEFSQAVRAGAIRDALDRIWSDPQWRQPWGLIVHVPEGLDYDLDVRTMALPPRALRASAVAVATPHALHRMVVSAIAVGFRLTDRFHLSSHQHIDEALLHVRSMMRRDTLGDGDTPGRRPRHRA